MAGLLFILPLLLAWFGCFWVVREVAARGRVDRDWRICWVLACLAFGSILTIIVEVSSLAHSLTRPTLAALWVVADLCLFWVGAQLAGARGVRISLSQLSKASAESRAFAQRTREQLRSWPADAKWLAGSALSFVLILLFVALVTPTTNYDSLSYHLGRMAHWIDQQSVNHFPTDDVRQLEFGPWSSYVMTNLFLLWGNDRLLNLVQWFAMLSSAIVLTWLTEQLVARNNEPPPDTAKRLRLIAFTCLFAVTLPIGMVESISTQNDYSTAFWVLSLFAIAFLLIRRSDNPWYVGAAGMCCGLGVLTKATTYVYAAPLIVAGGRWWLRRVSSPAEAISNSRPTNIWCGKSGAFRLSSLFVGAFLVLNSSHMARNYALFGSPLGSSEIRYAETNRRISPAVAASNAIRNLALHANTGIPWLTRSVNAGLAALHRWTGCDLNDRATTLNVEHFEFLTQFTVEDSLASCPVHVFLALIAVSLVIATARRNPRVLGYAALVVTSMLLFCAYLRWQLWHTRLHLAWFLLLAPVSAVAFAARFPRWTMRLSSLALLSFAVFTFSQNKSRPVFSADFWSLTREEQYFTHFPVPRLHETFVPLADRIVASGCQSVGLKSGFCGFEYPLWIMLRNRGFQGRLDRCFVENASASIRTSAPKKPDVILSSYAVAAGATNAYPYIEELNQVAVLWAKKPVDVPRVSPVVVARVPKAAD